MVTFEIGLSVFCTMATSHGGQGVECRGLNENGSHRLICLKAWSLVGGTVLRRIRRYGHAEGAVPRLEL